MTAEPKFMEPTETIKAQEAATDALADGRPQRMSPAIAKRIKEVVSRGQVAVPAEIAKAAEDIAPKEEPKEKPKGDTPAEEPKHEEKPPAEQPKEPPSPKERLKLPPRKGSERTAEDWKARHDGAMKEVERLKAELAAAKSSAADPKEEGTETKDEKPKNGAAPKPAVRPPLNIQKMLKEGLSDAEYEHFAKEDPRLTRELLDLVISGARDHQQRLNTEIEKAAGGSAAQLEYLKRWASENLNESEWTYFQNALLSDDHMSVVEHIRALRLRVEESEGKPVRQLLAPTATATGSGRFRTMEDLHAEQKKVKYGSAEEKKFMEKARASLHLLKP